MAEWEIKGESARETHTQSEKIEKVCVCVCVSVRGREKEKCDNPSGPSGLHIL